MSRQPLAMALGLVCLALSACGDAPAKKGTPDCPGAQVACGEVCALLERDREHCGKCGQACGTGEICSDGECTLSCPDALTSCGSACHDLDTDAKHCGSCDQACKAGEVCVNGGCNASCPAGQEACEGRCVDLAADADHCGTCGKACTTGDACVNGGCAECVAGSMTGNFPQLVTAELGASQHDMNCGFEKAAKTPDVSYAFTAPRAGVYEIDSEGSEVDVILGLLEGTCGGRTLGCADTTEVSRQSSLRLILEQDETVVVVAEAKSAKKGKVRLRMSQVDKVVPAADACAPIVVGGEIPKTIVGDTSSGVDHLTADCGAQGNTEQLYQFTAPATGRYVFDTYGSNFDTVLAVLKDGCQGARIACSDDFETGYGDAASVTVKLFEGDSVLILVEGTSGPGKFTLHASASSTGDIDACCFAAKYGGCGNDPVEACVCAIDNYCCTEQWDLSCAKLAKSECDLNCKPPVDSCEVTALPAKVPQKVTGTTIGALNVFVPSCSTDGSPERLYSFTAPEAGAYAFDTGGSAYDTVVYVLQGNCVGDEIACNDEYGPGPTSRAIVSLSANQTVVVAVDGYGGEADTFTLSVERADGGATGDCCVPHGGIGCSVPAIKQCVCDFDPYCCDPDNGWDDICVSDAVVECQVCE